MIGHAVDRGVRGAIEGYGLVGVSSACSPFHVPALCHFRGALDRNTAIPDTHGSGRVQLISARAPVQITTAPEYEPGVPVGFGVYAPHSDIVAPFAHRASTLAWRRQSRPLAPWCARTHAPAGRGLSKYPAVVVRRRHGTAMGTAQGDSIPTYRDLDAHAARYIRRFGNASRSGTSSPPGRGSRMIPPGPLPR
jgi:hypothetical protein